MKMNQEVKRIARKVNGKLTTVFDPEHLEVLARHNAFVQRSVVYQLAAGNSPEPRIR
jgi:hypothetical protein